MILFSISKYSVISGDMKIEYTIAGIAVLFFSIGVFVNKKNKTDTNSNTLVKENIINTNQIKTLGISEREYEILVEVANGLSNKQIAERLFVTESTVKTHVSNLFVKLDAKRRTQAIQKAKEWQIIS